MSPVVSAEEAVARFGRGEFLIIVDDENRENEGDLAIAAEFADAQAINFCAKHGRGLICTPMAGELIDRFGLPMMTPPEENRSGFGTPFTVSVEAARGVTTGISAFDRARTVATLIDPHAAPDDIVMPGHTFPLRARAGGVLERRGQTEASVDLARLAGRIPAAVICEIMNDDGSMARLAELKLFAARHDMKIVTVDAIARHRLARELLARPLAQTA